MEHLPGLEWCIGDRHVIRKCSLLFVHRYIPWLGQRIGDSPMIVEIAEYSESEILHVPKERNRKGLLVLQHDSCAPQLIFYVAGSLFPTPSTFFSPRMFEKMLRPPLSSFQAQLKTSKINGSSNHTLASRHTQSVVEVAWNINKISANGNLLLDEKTLLI